MLRKVGGSSLEAEGNIAIGASGAFSLRQERTRRGVTSFKHNKLSPVSRQGRVGDNSTSMWLSETPDGSGYQSLFNSAVTSSVSGSPASTESKEGSPLDPLDLYAFPD